MSQDHNEFARAVVQVFGAEYLREENHLCNTQKTCCRSKRQEVFQVFSVQSIACIGTGRTSPKVCVGSTNVTPKKHHHS